METQKETLQAIKTLMNKGIKADYLFPSYNLKEDEERFVICVYPFNLDKALEICPNANIIASN